MLVGQEMSTDRDKSGGENAGNDVCLRGHSTKTFLVDLQVIFIFVKKVFEIFYFYSFG